MREDLWTVLIDKTEGETYDRVHNTEPKGDGIEVIKYYEQFNDWYKKQDLYSDWTISEF